MGFEAFLQHTCDIYHIVRSDTSPGYNLPSSPELSYLDEPDIKEQICNFSLRGALRVSQNEPYATLDGRVKLALQLGTDIRINDKVLHVETGEGYIAEAPVPIRDHHITVMLRRRNEEKRL